jgi:hypothetical protein
MMIPRGTAWTRRGHTNPREKAIVDQSPSGGPPQPRRRERSRLSEYLSRHPNTALAWIGYRIFKWLLLLTVTILAILVVFAALTFPRSVPDSVPVAERFNTLQAARTAWLNQVKDLGQIFLLTPIFPLMGAVLGYIFGVSSPPGRATGASQGGDALEEQQR